MKQAGLLAAVCTLSLACDAVEMSPVTNLAFTEAQSCRANEGEVQ